jgi:hypothetical protein
MIHQISVLYIPQHFGLIIILYNYMLTFHYSFKSDCPQSFKFNFPLAHYFASLCRPNKDNILLLSKKQ